MSQRTTYFGPRVSFRTTLADAGPVHVYGDSSSTLEWDGIVNFQSASLRPSAETVSASSTVLDDGEFAVTSVSDSSCVLAFRSGVTTYTFIADTGAVA